MLTVVTPPQVEPISIADCKARLRIDDDSQDDVVLALIRTARRKCESTTRRALMTQTLRLNLESFATWEIELERPPLQSVSSVKYLDADNVQQTVSSSDYVVSTTRSPGAIKPAFNASWPSGLRCGEYDAVEINYVAGWSDREDIPDDLVTGIVMFVGHLWENREGVVLEAGVVSVEVPMGVRDLWFPYTVPRIHRYGGKFE